MDTSNKKILSSSNLPLGLLFNEVRAAQGRGWERVEIELVGVPT